MKLKALKDFQGRYGHIRRGQQFNSEPGYGNALLKNKLVEVLDPGEPGQRQNKAIPRAPARAGKGAAGSTESEPDKSAAESASTSAATPDDGKTLTSASLRQGPASTKPTSGGSATGGRRGNPTPRTNKRAAK